MKTPTKKIYRMDAGNLVREIARERIGIVKGGQTFKSNKRLNRRERNNPKNWD